MIRASALRFLLTVSPLPKWIVVAFAANVLLGVVTLLLRPEGIDSAFGSILLLQMFAASNGFSVPASRGYFDPLLTGEHSRQRVAIGSLAAAALPGLVAWGLLVLVAAGFDRARIAAIPHRHLAIAIVSVFAWAGGLALPRMAIGGLWVFVLVSTALFRGILAPYLTIVHSSPAGLVQLCQSTLAFAICPFLLLGDVAAATNSIVIGGDVILLLVVVWFAVRYVGRRDYALMDPA